MQLDRWECVFQCNCFVSVCIYIVPLSIICMHNLKGKYVRLFGMWSDRLITASFLLSKVLFCFFFFKFSLLLFLFLFYWLPTLCFQGLMRIHSKREGWQLLCRFLSIEPQVLKGKFTRNWNCLLKAGVLCSNPTQPFWSLVEWHQFCGSSQWTWLQNVKVKKREREKKIIDNMKKTCFYSCCPHLTWTYHTGWSPHECTSGLEAKVGV